MCHHEYNVSCYTDCVMLYMLVRYIDCHVIRAGSCYTVSCYTGWFLLYSVMLNGLVPAIQCHVIWAGSCYPVLCYTDGFLLYRLLQSFLVPLQQSLELFQNCKQKNKRPHHAADSSVCCRAGRSSVTDSHTHSVSWSTTHPPHRCVKHVDALRRSRCCCYCRNIPRVYLCSTAEKIQRGLMTVYRCKLQYELITSCKLQYIKNCIYVNDSMLTTVQM